MRSIVKASACAALVAGLALSVRAADEANLPIEPFARAQKGDWEVLRGTTTVKKKDPCGHGLGPELVVVASVGEPGSTVEVSAIGHRWVGECRDEDRRFMMVSTKEIDVASFFRLFQLGADARYFEAGKVTVADALRKVGDRDFACKKLTFTVQDGQRTETATLWLCADVKGLGVVAAHVRGPEGAVDLELAGFGTATGTTFGKSAKDLLPPS
jgi:hypothetical protein